MSEAQPINPAVEAYRQRYETFVSMRDGDSERPEPFSIDIDDLIGAKGDKLESSPHDRFIPMFPDPSYNPDGYYYVKTRITDAPFDFFDGVELDETYRECTERVLGKLITRKAEQLQEPLMQAAKALREPLRTIAVSCIFLDEDPDLVARTLGASVETIEFLTQVALDFLATSIGPA